MRFTVDRLDHLVLTCADVELTAAWYERVLGMEREDFGPEGRCALKFGGQKINVRPADADHWVSGKTSRPGPRIFVSSPRWGRRTWWDTCTRMALRSRRGRPRR